MDEKSTYFDNETKKRLFYLSHPEDTLLSDIEADEEVHIKFHKSSILGQYITMNKRSYEHCIKAIEKGIIPPTINYEVPDEECDLDIVPNKARIQEIEYAMSNSLGFGGHNSSIIFKKYTD